MIELIIFYIAINLFLLLSIKNLMSLKVCARIEIYLEMSRNHRLTTLLLNYICIKLVLDFIQFSIDSFL